MTINSNTSHGVITKPFSINLIALAHTIGPISLIIYSFSINDYRYLNPTHWSWLFNLENSLFLVLSPIIAIGIYISHLYGWILSLGFLIYCIGSFSHSYFFSPFNTFSGLQYLLFLATNLFIIGALISKETREPFFHPKMQWWKHDPRVAISLHAKLENSHQTIQGFTNDISKSGLYLISDAKVKQNDPFFLTLKLSDSNQLQLEGRVIWVNGGQKKEVPRGFGMRFIQMDRSTRNQLKKFVNTKMREKLK